MSVSSSLALDTEVYEMGKASFPGPGGTVHGYAVGVRTTFAHPVTAVLDASHDHVHLSERDRDIKRENVTRTECTQEVCRINVHVLVGSFFPTGRITYELDVQVHEREGGGLLIEWSKNSGTRFIKHLHGELRLAPLNADNEATAVDYHLEVAAPRLSAEKLAAKAVAYLERLGVILDERHQGHASLWSQMTGEF